MASKLLLVVVFVLDLIAFALAVAAEQRRAKVSLSLLMNFVGFLIANCFFFDMLCGVSLKGLSWFELVQFLCFRICCKFSKI